MNTNNHQTPNADNADAGKAPPTGRRNITAEIMARVARLDDLERSKAHFNPKGETSTNSAVSAGVV